MAIELDMMGIYRGATVGTPSLGYYRKDTFLEILEDDLSSVFFGEGGQDFTEDETTVTYHHSHAKLTGNYPAIYDNPHTSQKANIGAEFNSLKPQIRLQETRLRAKVRKGDTVTVRGIPYHVEDYRSDGVGVMTLLLRKN